MQTGPQCKAGVEENIRECGPRALPSVDRNPRASLKYQHALRLGTSDSCLVPGILTTSRAWRENTEEQTSTRKHVVDSGWFLHLKPPLNGGGASIFRKPQDANTVAVHRCRDPDRMLVRLHFDPSDPKQCPKLGRHAELTQCQHHVPMPGGGQNEQTCPLIQLPVRRERPQQV